MKRKELTGGEVRRMEAKWKEASRQGGRYEREGGWKTRGSAW